MITFNQYLDSLNEGFFPDEMFEQLYSDACSAAMAGIPMNKITISLKRWVMDMADADEYLVDDLIRRVMDRVQQDRKCWPTDALPPYINSPGPGVN